MIPIPIIGPIVDGIFGIFKGKQERKLAQTKGNIERVERADNKVAEWEAIQAEASKSSWKDEFWTVTFGGVFWMAFIDPDRLERGLAVLAAMDPNMQILIGTCVAAAFGRAELGKWVNRK